MKEDPKLNFLGFRFCRLDKFLAITIWNIQTTYTFWSLYNSQEFLHVSGPLRPLQLVMGFCIGKKLSRISLLLFDFQTYPSKQYLSIIELDLRFDHPFSTLPKKLIRLHKEESFIWNKSQIFCTKCPQLTPFCKVKLNCEKGSSNKERHPLRYKALLFLPYKELKDVSNMKKTLGNETLRWYVVSFSLPLFSKIWTMFSWHLEL